MDGRSARRIALVAARAFCTAFCARSVLKLVNQLLSRQMSLSGLLQGRDCVRLAVFLATYSGTYQVVVRLLEIARKTRDGFNAATAAGLAGLSINLVVKSDRQSILLFTLARGLGALYNTLTKRGYLKQLPFGSLVLYSICHWVLCTALVFKPHLLPKSYYRALLKYSESYDDHTVAAMFRQAAFVPCDEILHRGISCWRHTVCTARRIFARFAKFYSVLYGLSVLMTPKRILRRPLKTVTSLAHNVLISTLFFTMDASVFMGSLCVLRKTSGRSPLPMHIMTACSTLASLALLVERSSRRPELTMFMLHHTLYVILSWLSERRVFEQGAEILKRLTEVLMFCVSMMPIMHAFEHERESNSSAINRMLSFVV